MKLYTKLFLVFNLFILVISCVKEERKLAKKTSSTNESMFNEDIRQYYFKTLDSAAYYIKKIDTLNTIDANKNYFLESRKWYKRAEPLLIAYDYENYGSINAPNLLKIELDDYTEIKKLQPKSYQVLEEYLFSEDVVTPSELYRVYSYLQVRIPFIRKNHIIFKQKDNHHLKMIRDAVITVATKGITGFDSPVLSNSLAEAKYTYETIEIIFNYYKNAFKDKMLYASWEKEIKNTISFLTDSNFDNFNRYQFIKNHTNKQLELITKTAKDWEINLSNSRTLNPDATNIFSSNFFNKKMFSPPHSPKITPERVALGKALFNDKTLSKSGVMSCATCHIKEKAFTDGFKVALGSNGKPLERNTPTLAYALYQKTFFYDGRAGGLESQIVNVANNKDEFHIDLDQIEAIVQQNPYYKTQFETLYKGKITNFNVRNAIATYIRSLAPFNSKFDRNMQGIESTITNDEIKGFNLFMGKAACATCHFPPTFNGTVPPKFNETEFENLGVTKTDNFKNTVLDDDAGLFYPFEVEERRSFFKTSTVRNAAVTGPYMHNGVYKTLDKVLEFYNKGGGSGMGLKVPYQTLPSDTLGLNEEEIKSIIAFINSLTDAEYQKNK